MEKTKQSSKIVFLKPFEVEVKDESGPLITFRYNLYMKFGRSHVVKLGYTYYGYSREIAKVIKEEGPGAFRQAREEAAKACNEIREPQPWAK